ncbi:SUN domain-containing ossification factor [Dictyocoela muelleri]|nr:SUN domain-containing ossification factor [Dictyocoela muelleri]
MFLFFSYIFSNHLSPNCASSVIFTYPKIKDTSSILNNGPDYIKTEIPFTFIVNLSKKLSLIEIELQNSEWFSDFPGVILISGYSNGWRQISKIECKKTREIQRFSLKCNFKTRFIKFDIISKIGEHGFICITRLNIFGRKESNNKIVSFRKDEEIFYLLKIIRRLQCYIIFISTGIIGFFIIGFGVYLRKFFQ